MSTRKSDDVRRVQLCTVGWVEVCHVAQGSLLLCNNSQLHAMSYLSSRTKSHPKMFKMPRINFFQCQCSSLYPIEVAEVP